MENEHLEATVMVNGKMDEHNNSSDHTLNGTNGINSIMLEENGLPTDILIRRLSNESIEGPGNTNIIPKKHKGDF